jgi:hypothetical protein
VGGFLLVSLCKGVPVLDVAVDVLVTPDEGLLLVNADYLHHLRPLFGHIPLVILLHHC